MLEVKIAERRYPQDGKGDGGFELLCLEKHLLFAALAVCRRQGQGEGQAKGQTKLPSSRCCVCLQLEVLLVGEYVT